MDGSIVWFRQDLRLGDNASLRAAMAAGPVLLVYVLDDAAAGAWAMGGAHRWWLHGSLRALAADLAAKGAKLVLRRGAAATIIPELARSTGVGAVHAGEMAEPWARAQDQAVREALPPGVRLTLHRTATLLPFGIVKTKTGGPYGIFSTLR